MCCDHVSDSITCKTPIMDKTTLYYTTETNDDEFHVMHNVR